MAAEQQNKSSSSAKQNDLKIKAGEDLKGTTSPQGGCSNYVFACFGLSGSTPNDDEPNPRGNGSPRDTRTKRVFPTLSGPHTLTPISTLSFILTLPR